MISSEIDTGKLMQKQKTYVLTVTYGNRWDLLKQVITAAINEPIDKMFIVDNGSQVDITELVLKEYPAKNIEVIKLAKNIGSAGGFHVGLERVLENDPGYILLLDDDNKPHQGAINAYLESFQREVSDSTMDALAIMGFRPTRFGALKTLQDVKVSQRPSSYFGFHILDIAYKIKKRLPWLKAQKNSNELADKTISLKIAPWSGLFFHSDLVRKYGLPNKDFVLYADDTEYTSRITQHGGKIILNSKIPIEDLDESWSLNKSFQNRFDSLLLGSGDFRAYYSIRNNNYLEHHLNPDKNLMHLMNAFLFKTILIIRGVMLFKISRLSLIFKAMNDGKNKRLGISSEFPI